MLSRIDEGWKEEAGEEERNGEEWIEGATSIREEAWLVRGEGDDCDDNDDEEQLEEEEQEEEKKVEEGERTRELKLGQVILGEKVQKI